jgi:hypothetical protein
MVWMIFVVMESILIKRRDLYWFLWFIRDQMIQVLILLGSIYFRYQIDLYCYNWLYILCIFLFNRIEEYLADVLLLSFRNGESEGFLGDWRKEGRESFNVDWCVIVKFNNIFSNKNIIRERILQRIKLYLMNDS